MADYAVHADVADRWRALSSAEQAQATLHIADASAILRLAIPDIDARIDAAPIPTGETEPDLLKAARRAVVDAVVRVMQNPNGAKRLQESMGDSAYTLDFDTDQPSGLFITADELTPLQPNPTGGQGYAIGTAIVQTRAGWAPVDPCSPGNVGWWPTG